MRPWEAGTHLCEACYDLDKYVEQVQEAAKRSKVAPMYGQSVRLYRRGD